jgi:hypothetical protein
VVTEPKDSEESINPKLSGVRVKDLAPKQDPKGGGGKTTIVSGIDPEFDDRDHKGGLG